MDSVIAKVLTERQCKTCQAVFVPKKHIRTRFCSDQCRLTYHNSRNGRLTAVLTGIKEQLSAMLKQIDSVLEPENEV